MLGLCNPSNLLLVLSAKEWCALLKLLWGLVIIIKRKFCCMRWYTCGDVLWRYCMWLLMRMCLWIISLYILVVMSVWLNQRALRQGYMRIPHRCLQLRATRAVTTIHNSRSRSSSSSSCCCCCCCCCKCFEIKVGIHRGLAFCPCYFWLSWKPYLEISELPYHDLAVIAESEDDLIKRLNECKDNMENGGTRVNMNKTTVIINGERQKLMQKATRSTCDDVECGWRRWCSYGAGAPFSSDRQHLSCDVCLEVGGEIIRTAVFILCTEAVHIHKHT